MPNISVQLRRGTDTEHSSFTGAEGEVTVDTTNDTLRVHDGTTAGGIRLAKLSEAGGSGTVVSIASGTGLTGGPITTSGTLSLAPIANLRALGNVSGVDAAPVAVEIKDEDAMTSNSDTALATQQSIKTYVDTQVAASTVSKFDSGWASSFGGTTVANNADMTVTHNLSTTAVTVAVYVNSSASDTNAQLVNTQSVTSGVGHTGYSITSLSSNSFTLSLSSNGYLDLDTATGNSSAVTYASKFLKVVVIG